MLAIVASIIALCISITTLLGIIFGVMLKIIKFLERQKQQDVELTKIRQEQSLMTTGLLVCMKNMVGEKNTKEIACTIKLFEEHLNNAAHT